MYSFFDGDFCQLISCNCMRYSIFQHSTLLFERCGLCGCTYCHWDAIIKSDSYLLTIEKNILPVVLS